MNTNRPYRIAFAALTATLIIGLPVTSTAVPIQQLLSFSLTNFGGAASQVDFDFQNIPWANYGAVRNGTSPQFSTFATTSGVGGNSTIGRFTGGSIGTGNMAQFDLSVDQGWPTFVIISMGQAGGVTWNPLLSGNIWEQAPHLGALTNFQTNSNASSIFLSRKVKKYVGNLEASQMFYGSDLWNSGESIDPGVVMLNPGETIGYSFTNMSTGTWGVMMDTYYDAAGNTVGFTMAATTVPEPMTCIALGGGVLALLRRRRAGRVS